MRHEVILERFFTSLISGDRQTARNIVHELIDADCPAEKISSHLFWPTLDQIDSLHREDQLSDLAYNYATRLLQTLVDQMQMRLEHSGQTRDKTIILVSGPAASEQLAGQMAADLLEADGYTVFFAGGEVANDEIVAQIGQKNADMLVVFGAAASTVPYTRLLIDRLHDTGVCPKLQIVVGAGVFNRADGLAEEIGADLWASDPTELLQRVNDQPETRMDSEQRTVGRRRRTSGKRAAAA